MKAAVDVLGFWGFCGLLFYEGFLSEMRCSQVSDATLTPYPKHKDAVAFENSHSCNPFSDR